MPITSSARQKGESEINYITRVAHSEAESELGPYPRDLSEKQMREVSDRARNTFKEKMGLTFTKENNKVFQDLATRLNKEELDKTHSEYAQKYKALVEQKKAEKADLLGLYAKPKEEQKDLITFPSREEELKGLFGGIKRRKTRASKKTRKNKQRKTQRRRRS